MPDQRVEFASALASRLCHDLLSPVGAFANGLELLGDEQDADMRARCVDLLEQSARASASKLKYFRLAFGSAGGFGDKVSVAEIRSAILGLIGDRPTKLNLLIAEESLPKPAVKILLNMALMMTDALVRGGNLNIAYEQQGDEMVEIVVHAEADRILMDKEIEKILSEGESAGELSSRTVPAVLVHAIAAQHGGQVMLARESDKSLIIGAMLRP
jgi:histidine phosphotransferase ChpT